MVVLQPMILIIVLFLGSAKSQDLGAGPSEVITDPPSYPLRPVATVFVSVGVLKGTALFHIIILVTVLTLLTF